MELLQEILLINGYLLLQFHFFKMNIDNMIEIGKINFIKIYRIKY